MSMVSWNSSCPAAQKVTVAAALFASSIRKGQEGLYLHAQAAARKKGEPPAATLAGNRPPIRPGLITPRDLGRPLLAQVLRARQQRRGQWDAERAS
jgi:hypothetical protein